VALSTLYNAKKSKTRKSKLEKIQNQKFANRKNENFEMWKSEKLEPKSRTQTIRRREWFAFDPIRDSGTVAMWKVPPHSPVVALKGTTQ
jgi:hypothetical protein